MPVCYSPLAQNSTNWHTQNTAWCQFRQADSDTPRKPNSDSPGKPISGIPGYPGVWSLLLFFSYSVQPHAHSKAGSAGMSFQEASEAASLPAASSISGCGRWQMHTRNQPGEGAPHPPPLVRLTRPSVSRCRQSRFSFVDGDGFSNHLCIPAVSTSGNGIIKKRRETLGSCVKIKIKIKLKCRIQSSRSRSSVTIKSTRTRRRTSYT